MCALSLNGDFSGREIERATLILLILKPPIEMTTTTTFTSSLSASATNFVGGRTTTTTTTTRPYAGAFINPVQKRRGQLFSLGRQCNHHRRRHRESTFLFTTTLMRAQKEEEEEKETASKEEEDEFEAKLGALRGKRSKRAKTASDDEVSMVTGLPKTTGRRAKQKKLPGVRDFMSDFTEEPKTKEWGEEKIIYEGPPARAEVAANVLMSWTVVWLPLTIQAAGRALWKSYKITDKRVCVISNSPLRKERTDVPMEQIKDVISAGRGIGAWGDMVITLRNDEKIELRSLPNFKELEKEIKQRMYVEKPVEF